MVVIRGPHGQYHIVAVAADIGNGRAQRGTEEVGYDRAFGQAVERTTDRLRPEVIDNCKRLAISRGKRAAQN